MGRTIEEAIEVLPADRRAKVEDRAAELIAEELSLQELRKAMRLTQAELAKRLGVRQDTISRAEQRADMLLSTLQSYVEAMGGRLALVAELPNRPPVRIKGARR
jgi:DNA-binding XRE family transcriptional regulator